MLTPGFLILFAVAAIVIYALRKEGKLGIGAPPQRYANMEDRYRAQRKERQDTIDAILDKINRRGEGSLTKKERELLQEHSRSLK